MEFIFRTSCEESKTTKKKRKMAFSKIIASFILVIVAILVVGVLYLGYLAVTLDYMGDLGYIISLIGFVGTALGYVLVRYMVKSEKENTKGGIVYDSALGNRDPNEI